MWKSLDKNILPEYDWIILGKWDEEEKNMAWQIGRMLHDKILEFFSPSNAAAYAKDSVNSFNPEDSTHFIEIHNQPDRSKREDVIKQKACGDCIACRLYPCINNDAVLRTLMISQ